jgi:hypothetical protein
VLTTLLAIAIVNEPKVGGTPHWAKIMLALMHKAEQRTTQKNFCKQFFKVDDLMWSEKILLNIDDFTCW